MPGACQFSSADFDLVESECSGREQRVIFDEKLRDSLNECLAYWSQELARPYRFTSPLAAHHQGIRTSKRKRRLPFVYELALHFEIAGGVPKHNGWNRDYGKVVGFARFLELVYGVLPESAKPKGVDTFIRDAEHIGLSPDFLKDQRGGSKTRAAYLLDTATAWRRSK